MECVIDYEFLTGAQGEEIIKELSVAGENVIETFHFKSPYHMSPHSSPENGLSWDDGLVEFVELYDTLSEAVSGFAHLYAYGEKCKYLKKLLAQPI
jgi:L-ribulose-5-phosphate 3-epimerase UlaE